MSISLYDYIYHLKKKLFIYLVALGLTGGLQDSSLLLGMWDLDP